MKNKTDTAVRHEKPQQMPNIISIEDNLLVWTFRKRKGKKYYFKIFKKMRGQIFV